MKRGMSSRISLSLPTYAAATLVVIFAPILLMSRLWGVDTPVSEIDTNFLNIVLVCGSIFASFAAGYLFVGLLDARVAGGRERLGPRISPRVLRQLPLNNDSQIVPIFGESRSLLTDRETFPLERRTEPGHYFVSISEIFNRGYGLELARLIANMITRSTVDFDRVIGIHNLIVEEKAGSDPRKLAVEGHHLAAVVATLLKKPYMLLYEGTDYFIYDGQASSPSERVIIIDDVLTTGGGTINAIKYLKERSISVDAVFVAVRRPQGEEFIEIQQRIQQQGVVLHCLIDSKALVDRLYQQEYITREQLEKAYQDSDFAGLTPPIMAESS